MVRDQKGEPYRTNTIFIELSFFYNTTPHL